MHAISAVHARNMSIMLKPHVDCANGVWRGFISFSNEGDWQAWFSQYELFINHYATLAQACGVEEFCVGVEYVGTVHREAEWRTVIDSVRANFSGLLTYAANWDNYGQVPFWDALDVVGIDAYFPLTNDTDPDFSTIMTGWSHWKAAIANFQTTVQKTVVFTEIGYCSQDGTNTEPWNWTLSGIVDLKEQTDCYEAVFQTFWREPWFGGIYWWVWDPDPAAGGPADVHYTPHGKPAEDVLKTYYLGTYDLALFAGWNLVTVPYRTSMTAKGFLDNVTGCTVVYAYNASTGIPMIVTASSPSENDIPLEAGAGYFVAVTDNITASLTRGLPVTSVSISLFPGWNLLGWYHAHATGAKSVLENVTNCSVVYWYDGKNSTPRIVTPASPPETDFPVTQGMGLFVAVTTESDWHGEG
jgi:hypothetical protein